jgi:hypothetical protein
MQKQYIGELYGDKHLLTIRPYFSTLLGVENYGLLTREPYTKVGVFLV